MKLRRLLENPYRVFSVLATQGKFRWLPDALFLRLMFRSQMGYWPNLNNPQTFSEKLQWLKLHHRREAYSVMADKWRVRSYIADMLGEEYLIPLLGVWDTPEEIDFAALPSRFVLKCNHNSGLGMYICRDKAAMDVQRVKQNLHRGLAEDYYGTVREWPYRDIPRKILCEQFMTDRGNELKDFKIHCFNGKAKMILVCADRFAESGMTEDFYTETWEHLPVCRPKCPNCRIPHEKPAQLEQMVQMAEKLAEGIPFLRVDFYISDGRIYFGELTFFPGSGIVPFQPESWDHTIGSWLRLPEKDKV